MGMKPDQIINNFTNGEISPRATGRFDISKYSNSSETLENFIIYQLGGVLFRPGTRYVADTKTSSIRSRLLKFQYSTEQNYIIEAGHLYFRFYTDGGRLEAVNPNIKLQTHFDGVDAATTFPDSSGSAHGNGVASGNVQIDTAQSKFGGASAMFDGTGDRISYADSPDWDFGSSDFIISAWVRLNNTSGNNMILGRVTGGTSYLYFGFEGTSLRFRDFSSGNVVDMSVSVTIAINTWYHVAVSRNGSNFRLFLDGVQQGATAVDADPLTARAVALDIGAMTANAAYVMNGWIDELQIVVGESIIANFTPETSAFPDLSPIELATPFANTYLNNIRTTQNADTMYLTTGQYTVRKLQRTNATTFTQAEVNFKGGPFLDDNIGATTITPSSATGTTVLTASTAIFQAGHVNSLWKVNTGIVRITVFTSTTQVTGTVETDEDGVAGTIGGTSAYFLWAEGSWSAVRGYPKHCTFHEGRLYFANTSYQPGGVWGSVPYAYELFKEGATDDDAIDEELNADTVVSIRWMSSSPKGLQLGTTGGVFVMGSGNQGLPITPDNVNAPRETFVGTADIQAKRMLNYTYYVKNDLQRFLESGYQFDVDAVDAVDTTLMADHILNAPIPTNIPGRGSHELGGAYDLDSQQSPNDRIWIVRSDGQIAVLTRNVRQEVNGWFRIVAGATVSCDGASGTGSFESIAIIQQEGAADQIWVIVNRRIGSATKRFVEYFTDENFKYEWDPVRVDCSLTLDNPITITGISLSSPVVITAAGHGLADGDKVRIDTVVGTHQLNGNEYNVLVLSSSTFSLYED